MASTKPFPIRSQVSQTQNRRITKKSASLGKRHRKNRALLNPYPIKYQNNLDKKNYKEKVEPI